MKTDCHSIFESNDNSVYPCYEDLKEMYETLILIKDDIKDFKFIGVLKQIIELHLEFKQTIADCKAEHPETFEDLITDP